MNSFKNWLKVNESYNQNKPTEEEIMSAIKLGNLPIVKSLVMPHIKVPKKAVQEAAYIGYIPMIKFLVERGGDIGSGVSFALMNNNGHIASYLLEKGGKPGPEDVFFAIKNGNWFLIDLLIEKGAKISQKAIDAAKSSNPYPSLLPFLISSQKKQKHNK